MNYKKRSSNSICERSMKMVTDILRLSSLSIASMSLGTAGHPASVRIRSSGKDSCMMAEEPVVPQFPSSRQSQEPKSRLKPMSYLVEPENWIKSANVLHDDKNVDGMASDYIEWVHKNQYYLGEASENSPIILPPPPRVLKLK
ncbi:uncharacterized protein J3R85_008480 [Psidium guajava]|nr:uncharacterized protein J3R85_008480 [Psidium guajava]